MSSAGKGVWGMLPQDLLKNPRTLVPSGTFSCSLILCQKASFFQQAKSYNFEMNG